MLLVLNYRISVDYLLVYLAFILQFLLKYTTDLLLGYSS
jgi:hypothetical protein